MYDPFATSLDLLRAHRDLAKVVDRAYGKTFKTGEDRVAFLFEKYQKKYEVKWLNNRKGRIFAPFFCCLFSKIADVRIVIVRKNSWSRKVVAINFYVST